MSSLNHFVNFGDQLSITVSRTSAGGTGWVIGNVDADPFVGVRFLDYAGGKADFFDQVSQRWQTRGADRGFATYVDQVFNFGPVLSAAADGYAPGPAATFTPNQRIRRGSGNLRSEVITDLGINKVFSGQNGAENSFATSVWTENFTADSASGGPVTVSASVRVDGATSPVFNAGNSGDVELNYVLWALKGEFAGFGNEEGAFDDVSVFFKDSAGSFFIDDLGALNLSDPRILDYAALCPSEDGCGPGSCDRTLTVGFDVADGEKFFLVGALMTEDLKVGRIDFFNTARLDGIRVSDGARLTSASGRPELVDGSYRFRPSLAAVPEPSTWAMLIAGFGLVGAGARRRDRSGAGSSLVHPPGWQGPH